ESDDVWVELMPGVPCRTASGGLVWIGREPGAGERRVYVDEEPLGPADAFVRGVVDVDGDRVLSPVSRAGRPGVVSLCVAVLESGLAAQVEVRDVGPSPEGMLSGRLRGDRLVLQHRSMAFTGVRTFVVRRSGTKTHRIDSFAEIPVLPDPR